MYSAELIERNTEVLLKYCKKHIKLHKSNYEEFKLNTMRKFPKFHENYPTLFFMIVENPTKFDMNRLKELLNLKKEVEENKISYEDASKNLGQKYYDEFVEPKI